MINPWEDLKTDIPEPGNVSDCDLGVDDLFDTDPDNCEVADDDEPDELNVYSEDDDEFEDNDEECES